MACFLRTVSHVGRVDSDEAYVLALCDQVYGAPGIRQHRFDWLVGDPGKGGRVVRLPVDWYWPDRNVVVEYREQQHDRPVPFFDKPGSLTVSGVHRGEQRARYDRRRDELIPAHDLLLVIIKPSDLDSDARGRLRRNRQHDLPVVARLLMAWKNEGPSEHDQMLELLTYGGHSRGDEEIHAVHELDDGIYDPEDEDG